MNPRIVISPANLPPFWNRRVLFFSNIHSIFYENAEEARQLMQEITGSRSYGGRVMSILDLLFHGRPNLILLEVAPAQSLMGYLTKALGLSLPGYEILDHRGYANLLAQGDAKPASDDASLLKILREHPAEWVDGFVTDANLVRIASALGKRTISTLEGSKDGNNKYLLHQHQVECNLPAFDTLFAANPGEVPGRFEELRRMGYSSAVVKAQIGASGYGMLKLPADGSQASAVPDFLFFEGPCMVQGWIEDGVLGARKIASPSVQLFLNDESVYLFDITEQILSEESVHQGNMSPPPVTDEHPEIRRELLSQAGMVATWLHGRGYRGTASVDFLVIERAGKLQVIICEANARVTGATYPALLARHFQPQGSWLMRNIRFSKALDGRKLLELMDRAGVLFQPGAAKGMIPFNFNTESDNKVIKGQFVCVGESRDDCNTLLVQTWSQLPVEWGYDRD